MGYLITFGVLWLILIGIVWLVDGYARYLGKPDNQGFTIWPVVGTGVIAAVVTLTISGLMNLIF